MANHGADSRLQACAVHGPDIIRVTSRHTKTSDIDQQRIDQGLHVDGQDILAISPLFGLGCGLGCGPGKGLAPLLGD